MVGLGAPIMIAPMLFFGCFHFFFRWSFFVLLLIWFSMGFRGFWRYCIRGHQPAFNCWLRLMGFFFWFWFLVLFSIGVFFLFHSTLFFLEALEGFGVISDGTGGWHSVAGYGECFFFLVFVFTLEFFFFHFSSVLELEVFGVMVDRTAGCISIAGYDYWDSCQVEFCL